MEALKNTETIDPNTVIVNNPVGGQHPESVSSTDVSQHVEVDGTATGSLGKALRNTVAGIMATINVVVPSANTIIGTAAVGGAAVATQSCTTDIAPDGDLTPEQQLFADAMDPTNPKLIAKGWVMPSILDGKPVVCVPVSPVPNNTAFTEAFKGFMDIEIRLINAKEGTYSITPVINRSSVEKIFKKGEELVPGKNGYSVSLVNQALKGATKRDLTPGVWIADREDPSTKAIEATILNLPEKFSFSEFNKYFVGANLSDKFVLSKDEAMNMIMDLTTFGLKFDTIVYPINPVAVAQSAINQSGN